MLSLVPVALFVLGAVVASLVGVISGRLHTGQGFLMGRSRCDACNAPLSPSSLIPIVSYLILRGKSGCCGARISPLSPLAELLLGSLFVLSYLHLGLTLALLFFLISLSVLLALVLYDLSHQILPLSLLAVFVSISAVAGFYTAPSTSAYYSSLSTALFIAIGLALIHFLSRGRLMGLADAPLTFGLTLLTGQSALSGFVFSFWIGAAVGILILLKRPSGSRMGVEVPFAPFLAAGFILAYFTQWNLFAFITVLP